VLLAVSMLEALHAAHRQQQNVAHDNDNHFGAHVAER